MKVVVKPYNNHTWAGVIRYKNCYLDLRPYLKKNGQRYTGFESDEDKAAQKRLSKALNTDLEKHSEYWDYFFIRLADEDLILDLNDPHDELKYYFLKKHKDINTSASQPIGSKVALLFDEEDEANKENVEFELEQDVYSFLREMSIADMRDALKLYGISAEDVSEKIVKNRLSKIAKDDPRKFKILWMDNKSRATQVLIETAVSKGVIRKSGERYFYGTESLGVSIHDTIAYLDDKERQDLKIAILDQIK